MTTQKSIWADRLIQEVHLPFSGNDAMDEVVFPGIPFLFIEARLKIHKAPTTDENFEILLISAYGDRWNLKLDDPPVLGQTDIHRIPVNPLRFLAGDKIAFRFGNSDGNLWALEVVYGCLG